MVIKLGSYSLTDDVVTKMRQKIEETRQKRVELGFPLCRMRNVNVLRPGLACTGEECSISRSAECSIGVYVGGFHTHPSQKAEPSIADLKSAYINDIECIGSVTEDAIRCLVRKGNKRPEDEMNILSLAREEENIPENITHEQWTIWKNARDEIWNKHFDTIDVG